MEVNILIPGTWSISDRSVDDKGYTHYKYEVETPVKEVALLVQNAMIKAESDILSPLIEEDFPCGVDYSLGPYWIH